MALTKNSVAEAVVEVRLEGAEEAQQGFDGVADGAEQAGKKIAETDAEFNNMSESLQTVGGRLARLGAQFAGIASAMAAFNATVGTVKKGVSLAVEFESQFAQVQTLNSQIGEQLKSDLLQLAAEVPQTAGDLTKAAYQAISAGIDPSQLISFLSSASETAIAAGGSMTEAVELLTAGVNAFGRQGETAASISNKLFSTVGQGVTTIPELNAVFGRAASSAAAYGISIDEVLGAIATLTLQGLPTQEAVTRVNAVIKELASESSTAAKALKKQGVAVGVNALKQKGLVGVLEEVNTATKGQASEISKLSSRIEAIQGMLMLTGDNMSKFGGIVKKVGDDTEATARANEIMADTTANVNAMFEAAKEGALRDLGTEVLPAINDLLKSMTDDLSNSGGAVKGFGVAVRGIIKTIQLFTENIGKIGLALAAAFGFAYYKPFIAQLVRIKFALQWFAAQNVALGMGAGRAYGMAFMQAAGAVMSGPMAIGLGVLIGAAIFDSITEAAEKKEKEAATKRENKAKEELAKFIKREQIKMDQVNDRLKVGNREEAVQLTLMEATKASIAGDDKKAKALQRLAQFLKLSLIHI